ncbi:hypothetical protein NQ315_003502 [Exocentrus adspersus]|uniref:RNase H type-1 domain-containing protein n=1 Tax=Exocentrus adspersus TaxID=1586481 RepID=A0AAV8V7M0_9CUCU|nr:hypothetical protein NQ315_003502 [Exocentrus adspersus]
MKKKIDLINGIDPYTPGRDRVKANLDSVPDVTIMDMVNYLILSHSFYADQQMKAYKSLEAYKFYEAGFVQDVFGEKINENAWVVIGKVNNIVVNSMALFRRERYNDELIWIPGHIGIPGNKLTDHGSQVREPCQGLPNPRYQERYHIIGVHSKWTYQRLRISQSTNKESRDVQDFLDGPNKSGIIWVLHFVRRAPN